MGTSKDQVAFVLDQLAGAGTITAKPMFGEYGVYCNGKIVALVCDDRLFIKPTPAGLAYAGELDRAPPYPGAKPYLVADERIDDASWLAGLVRVTAAALPAPKPKRPKKPAQASQGAGPRVGRGSS